MRSLPSRLVLTSLSAAFFSNAVHALSVSAPSATVIEATSGKVLWSQRPNEPRFPASTTKIMTGLLLVENCKPDDIIVAPSNIEDIKESSMHLKPGERVRAKDMLYAIMLRSANDGCYAVAMHLAKSVPDFAKMMNKRAAALGCTSTYFANPNGLNDPQHVTSAHDLALIAREAMTKPAFREVVRTWKVKINRGTNYKDLWMINHNKLLKKSPEVIGIKTGWTNPAGKCFVGSAARGDLQVISVVMKSKNWEEDTLAINKWCFANFSRDVLLKAGQLVGKVSISGGVVDSVPVLAADNVVTAYKRGFHGASKVELSYTSVHAPVKKGDLIGMATVTDAEGYVQKVPVLAERDVPALTFARVLPSKSTMPTYIFGGALGLGALYMRGKVRRIR